MKSKEAVYTIAGADGPTSVFIHRKNVKLSLRQKIQRIIHRLKTLYAEKTLKCDAHSMDEVMEYLIKKYGFVEVNKDSDEATNEYDQMRASFIIQHAPELLGEYAAFSHLAPKSGSPEDVKDHIRQSEERMKKALEIPPAVFDIDYHKFTKSFDDINDNMHIIIEKRYAYIGGGATGSKKLIRKFHHIYKDIYRYYGVTEEDIRSRSERYKDVLRSLRQ